MAKKKDDPLATKVLKVAGKGAIWVGKELIEAAKALMTPNTTWDDAIDEYNRKGGTSDKPPIQIVIKNNKRKK